jgi:hypothetical protein
LQDNRPRRVRGDRSFPMITFFKLVLEAYLDGTGRYPLPMVWTF